MTFKLTLHRTFEASLERVFDAWTNIASSGGFWGPEGFTLAFHELDLRPGGKWRLGMRAADGVLHVSGGTYRKISVPVQLVFTHGWEDAQGKLGNETVVTVTLTGRDGKTVMLFEQVGFENESSRKGHEGGWTEAFGSLAVGLEMSAHR